MRFFMKRGLAGPGRTRKDAEEIPMDGNLLPEEGGTENDPMRKEAELLVQLRSEKSDLKDQLESIKARMEEVDQSLVDLMVQTDTKELIHRGKLFYLTTSIRASGKAERREELYAALRANGAGDLIVETVNSNRLAGFVRKKMAENGDQLPDWLEPVVTVTEKQTIGVRKA